MLTDRFSHIGREEEDEDICVRNVTVEKHTKEWVYMLNDFRKGYLAGIIDGEGTLMIRRHRALGSSTGYTYSAFLTIANTELSIIEAVKDMIEAGYICTHKRKNVVQKDCYLFHVTRMKDVYRVLTELQDYFMSKRKQLICKLILEFCESRMSYTNTWKGGRSVYTMREIEIFEEVKKLNKRGV